MISGSLNKMTRVDLYGGALQLQGFRERIPCMRRVFSARPKFHSLPPRFTEERRIRKLRKIMARCVITAAGCWLYPALRNGIPYIDVQSDGKRQQWAARRLVWVLCEGDIPLDFILEGRCTQTACVAPAHQRLQEL